MRAQLGSFRLLSPLGKGGMGEVWRARHVVLQRDVAVKIDLHPPAREAAAAFLREVAIIAGLDHPNVGRILEHGVVPIEVQESTVGHFRTGSRWLAMELAPGGSVAQVPPRTWEELLHVARGLLQGLAHAHARGVIHRDIKPGNLLLAGPAVGIESVPETIQESRILLSDFGISERREQPSTNTEDAVGTPTYMAPEQIEARWRDQGPWTDLYAVGVMLWRLVTGDVPYPGASAFAVYRGHLFSPVPVPALLPGFPPALAPILRRCLAKDPGQRYRFAIELLEALEGIDGATGVAAALEELPTVRNNVGTAEATTQGGSGGLAQDARGGGLSLFGLQIPPLVGRDTATQHLLEKLHQVVAQRTLQVVVVRAEEGLGRTRLAHWICERSHELGLADHWLASHQRGAEPGAALVEALHAGLLTNDLDDEELVERLTVRFEGTGIDVLRLKRLLRSDPTLAPRERRGSILKVISACARSLPLVLVFDDAHLDREAFELVDLLLAVQHRRPSAVLVVLTVQERGLVESPAAMGLFEDLLDDPAVSELRLDPLDPVARRRLSRSLVGLDGGVSQRLEERTGGNPQFAVELVRSWIDQGILVLGPKGYVLDRAAEQGLPSGLGAVWERRLEAVLADWTDDECFAVEVAACLGPTLTTEAWRHTVALLELDVDPQLLERLVRARLLLRSESGVWMFAHPLVPELIEARSRRVDRWIDANLAAAIHLEEIEDPNDGRLARHLIAGEQLERAIEPLFRAIYTLFDLGDARDGTLMDTLVWCFDELGLPADDERRGRHAIIAAMIARERESSKAALALVSDILERFTAPLVRAMAQRELARIHQANGAFDQAVPCAEAAMQAFAAIEDDYRATDSQQLLGNLLVSNGETDAGRSVLLVALARVRENGWEDMEYPVVHGLVRLEQRLGRLQAARDWLDELHAYTLRLGRQAAMANVANIQGELARAAGDEQAAAVHYAAAMEAFEELEMGLWVYPLLNLGVLDIRAGRYAVAIARVERLLVHLQRHPHRVVRIFGLVVLFAAKACAGDADAARDAFSELRQGLEQVTLADGDLAAMAETGGRALALSDPAAGRRALQLALDQYQQLHRSADVERLRLELEEA